MVACRCRQEELQKQRYTLLERYSNLGSLTRFTFDNLTLKGRESDSTSEERFAHAWEAARNFAANPQGWLILVGPCGCGKTHLAAAIVNYRLGLGHFAFYITVPDLLDHLRATFSPSSDTPYDELFDQVCNAPLLVLDDFGMQSSTPWAKEKLDQLLTHRFNAQLPTVITAETPIEEMEERWRTRLNDPNLCQVLVVQERVIPSAEHGEGLGLEFLRKMTFDNFDRRRVNLPLEQRQNLEEAFRLAQNFAQSPEGWLVLQGENGCGKTHLAAAIANYQLQVDKPVLFIVVADFLDHLRSTFSPESKVPYDEYFERVRKAPLLILDDFGEQSTTAWAQAKLYQVINYRYNANLPTVITTCFTLDEIERRIASRMVDPRLSVVFNITAPDYRGDIRPSSSPRAPTPRRKSR